MLPGPGNRSCEAGNSLLTLVTTAKLMAGFQTCLVSRRDLGENLVLFN